MVPRLRSVTLVLCAVALISDAGCGPKERAFVQREWSLTLRELGIVPVFPPREDVIVGDVYATNFDPEGSDAQRLFEAKWSELNDSQRQQRLAIGMSPRLARVDMERAILDEYSKTLSAPATGPDYNSIIGNPALAAANDSVAKAERDVQAAKDIVKIPGDQAKAAADGLTKTQRAVEDANTQVTRAEAELREGATKPADPDKIQQLESQLSDRKSEARAADIKQTEKQRRFDDTPAEPKEPKAVAEREWTEAKRVKADADRAVTFAEADLASEKARKKDLRSLEIALVDAKKNQADRKNEETKAIRTNADAAEALKVAQSESTPKVAKAEEKLTAIKAVRDSIEKAGARFLYSQPRDAVRNVYDAQSNLSGTGGADDLLNSRVNRLRLVGFPEFATASFTQGDLAALIPIEGFSLGINISSTDIERVSVKVPAAESYGLSTLKLMSAIADYTENFRGATRQWRLKPELVDAARFRFQPQPKAEENKSPKRCTTHTQPDGVANGTVYFRIISEVYYARALDISVFSSSSFGVRAQLAAPIPTSVPKEGEPKQGSLESFQQPGIGAAGLDSPSGAAALADLRARLGTTATVPGGQMQLVSYNEKSIGLRRVWDRPIAIGYRGLTLTVDLDTRLITEVRESSSGISTFMAQPTSPEPLK